MVLNGGFLCSVGSFGSRLGKTPDILESKLLPSIAVLATVHQVLQGGAGVAPGDATDDGSEGRVGVPGERQVGVILAVDGGHVRAGRLPLDGAALDVPVVGSVVVLVPLPARGQVAPRGEVPRDDAPRGEVLLVGRGLRVGALRRRGARRWRPPLHGHGVQVVVQLPRDVGDARGRVGNRAETKKKSFP